MRFSIGFFLTLTVFFIYFESSSQISLGTLFRDSHGVFFPPLVIDTYQQFRQYLNVIRRFDANNMPTALNRSSRVIRRGHVIIGVEEDDIIEQVTSVQGGNCLVYNTENPPHWEVLSYEDAIKLGIGSRFSFAQTIGEISENHVSESVNMQGLGQLERIAMLAARRVTHIQAINELFLLENGNRHNNCPVVPDAIRAAYQESIDLTLPGEYQHQYQLVLHNCSD